MKGLIIFFFFFFFNNIEDERIIQSAFDIVCGKKLNRDGYCDLSSFIRCQKTKQEILQQLQKIKSPFVHLYYPSFPKAEKALDCWKSFLQNYLPNKKYEEDYELSTIEAEAIIHWVYRTYSNDEERQEKTKSLFSYINKKYEILDLDFAMDIVYIKSKVEINIINSVDSFIKEIKSISSNEKLFYRGHSNINYLLLPSIMRNNSWRCHEHDMYNECIIECSKSFENCNTHLDKLVLMQHYGLPTRLLDITQNPLVALYFACDSNFEKNGEVIVLTASPEHLKYPQSDTVSVLASLAPLSNETKEKLSNWSDDRKENDFSRTKLLHEVRNEKPAFEDHITRDVINQCCFVVANKKNERIVNQDGAFILCGLIDINNFVTEINKYRYSEKQREQVFVVPKDKKKEILAVLDSLSINKARLFPEIEDVALYIKEKYIKG